MKEQGARLSCVLGHIFVSTGSKKSDPVQTKEKQISQQQNQKATRHILPLLGSRPKMFWCDGMRGIQNAKLDCQVFPLLIPSSFSFIK
jgi:hypothetical protein